MQYMKKVAAATLALMLANEGVSANTLNPSPWLRGETVAYTTQVVPVYPEMSMYRVFVIPSRQYCRLNPNETQEKLDLRKRDQIQKFVSSITGDESLNKEFTDAFVDRFGSGAQQMLQQYLTSAEAVAIYQPNEFGPRCKKEWNEEYRLNLYNGQMPMLERTLTLVLDEKTAQLVSGLIKKIRE